MFITTGTGDTGKDDSHGLCPRGVYIFVEEERQIHIRREINIITTNYAKCQKRNQSGVYIDHKREVSQNRALRIASL